MRPCCNVLFDLLLSARRACFGRCSSAFFLSLGLALALALSLPASPATAQQSDYLLNAGDLLEISVWKEEGMEKEVLVLPDGMISFPLAGHLKAAGNTAKQLQDAITQKLKKYIPNPVVTVSVKDLGGNRIYVIGEVRLPNVYSTNRRIDVMQALSMAGGLSAYADEDDIQILRRENGKQVAYPFDYNEIKKGRKLESNILLKSGDVVVVTE